MRLLLDTCAVLWWFDNNPRLGKAACGVIEHPDNDIIVSIVSLWEVAIKCRLGRWDVPTSRLRSEIRRSGWHMLALEARHIEVLKTLDAHHRDPFDHILISQAICDDIVLMTDDSRVTLYPVRHMPC